MRILVTKTGDEMIKTIVEENTIQNQSKTKTKNFNDTNKSNKSFMSNHLRNKSRDSSHGRTNNSKFRETLNKLDKDHQKLTAEDVRKTTKVISIHQKKLNIPKNITDRYNTNSDSKTNLILPSLTLPKFKDKTSSNFNLTNNTQNNLNTTSTSTKDTNMPSTHIDKNFAKKKEIEKLTEKNNTIIDITNSAKENNNNNNFVKKDANSNYGVSNNTNTIQNNNNKNMDKYLLQNNTKLNFYRIQESPELLLFRKDEGLLYHFPSDLGFTMLNPNVQQKEEK